MPKEKNPAPTDPMKGYPSGGLTMLVPVDEKAGEAGNPTQFARPFVVTSTGNNQRVNGFIYLEPGDTYKGNSGPGVFFIKDEANARRLPTEQPYAGR